MISAYCDLCKVSTRRCEYYPKGEVGSMASVSLAIKKIPRIPRDTTVMIPATAMSATVPVSWKQLSVTVEIYRLSCFGWTRKAEAPVHLAKYGLPDQVAHCDAKLNHHITVQL
jgi:hypothetical protein